jgi:hypothetical protein
VPTHDVVEVSWPDDDSLRQRCASGGIPRLLIVADGHPPPDDWDELEDWIRPSADAQDMEARRAALRERHQRLTGGLLVGADGTVARDGRRVHLSPVDAAMLRCLLARRGRVVPSHVVESHLAEALGEANLPRGIGPLVRRLQARLRPLGVRVHLLGRHGCLLEVA